MIEVVKSGNATAAAKKFHVTNPVITNAIKAVELLANLPPLSDDEKMENPLFVRGATLKPTSKGMIFLQDALAVDRAFRKMVANMRRPESAHEGQVKMHISDLLMATVALPAISDL